MFKSDKLNSHLNDVKIYDKILFGVAFLLAFFFMSHPDLWETANHSYVFLECLFDGQFMNFETLTFVPLDRAALDVTCMNEEDLKRVNRYQQTVFEAVSPYLTEKEKMWLEKECENLKRV